MDYRDKSPSNETGSTFNRRHRAKRVSIQPALTPAPYAEDIRGLAVEEHVARLRDQLLPLVERAHRTARDSIEAIRRTRQAPAMRVERAEAVEIRLVAP
jgi:hypothetical protein